MTEYDNDLDLDEEQPDDGGPADLDAFWAEERTAPKLDGMPFRMYGRKWRLPSRLPALFTVQMNRIKSSSSPDDVQALLAALLPAGLVDEMIRHNVGDRQLGVMLTWATGNIKRPDSISLESAARLYDKREREQAGKARKPRPKNKKRKSSGRR